MSKKVDERALLVWMLFLGVILVGTFDADAANPTLATPEPPAPTTSNCVKFAQIPLTADRIAITLDSVKLSLHRKKDLQEITVASNYPSHWNVTGAVIRQAGMASLQKGVALRADAAGGQIVLNGKVYQVPRDADGAIRNLQVKDGIVTVNGRKLEPIPGSDVPGPSTGPDSLEIDVSDAYRGGLTLMGRGTSQINLEGWRGGNIAISLTDHSTFTAGKLIDIDKAVVDIRGTGGASIEALSCKTLVANVEGEGTLTVATGSAELSNATISGSGKISLRGRFKNLRKSVQGSGNIEILN